METPLGVVLALPAAATGLACVPVARTGTAEASATVPCVADDGVPCVAHEVVATVSLVFLDIGSPTCCGIVRLPCEANEDEELHHLRLYPHHYHSKCVSASLQNRH